MKNEYEGDINKDIDNVLEYVKDTDVLKEDLQILLADNGRELEMLRSMMEDPNVRANTETSRVVQGLIANGEADRLAILRVIDRVSRRKASLERADVPQTVANLVRDYVKNAEGSFTSKMVMESIRPKTAARISEGAVSQALRRLVADSVEVVQKGVGPAPTYFRKLAGTETK